MRGPNVGGERPAVPLDVATRREIARRGSEEAGHDADCAYRRNVGPCDCTLQGLEDR